MDLLFSWLPYLVLAGAILLIVSFRDFIGSKLSPVVRGLVCPECDRLTLKITHQMKVEDEARDEAALQAVRCSSCGFTAAATYEEPRRGRLEEETVQHTGMAVSQPDYDALAAALDEADADRARRLVDAARDKGAPFQIEFRVDPSDNPQEDAS